MKRKLLALILTVTLAITLISGTVFSVTAAPGENVALIDLGARVIGVGTQNPNDTPHLIDGSGPETTWRPHSQIARGNNPIVGGVRQVKYWVIVDLGQSHFIDTIEFGFALMTAQSGEHVISDLRVYYSDTLTEAEWGSIVTIYNTGEYGRATRNIVADIGGPDKWTEIPAGRIPGNVESNTQMSVPAGAQMRFILIQAEPTIDTEAMENPDHIGNAPSAPHMTHIRAIAGVAPPPPPPEPEAPAAADAPAPAAGPTPAPAVQAPRPAPRTFDPITLAALAALAAGAGAVIVKKRK